MILEEVKYEITEKIIIQSQKILDKIDLNIKNKKHEIIKIIG